MLAIGQDVLVVSDLAKSYDSAQGEIRAIDSLSFSVKAGEFVCIVGPSGCGKTTLLRCLSGIMRSTQGEARLDGKLIVSPPKSMALVFQEYTRSLLPWMSVIDNVQLPLKNKAMSKAKRFELAMESLEVVGLAGEANRYPWQLSGGMQQRVAIARALAYQPEVLLMDEPFASVDAQTRAGLEDLILKVRERFDVTVVLVTHDIDEAVYLADRVIVLSARPTRVLEIVDVGLPSPRDQVTTKELPEFTRLRAHVARQIAGRLREVDSGESDVSRVGQ